MANLWSRFAQRSRAMPTYQPWMFLALAVLGMSRFFWAPHDTFSELLTAFWVVYALPVGAVFIARRGHHWPE